MNTTVDAQIASVLCVLSAFAEEATTCPLSIFARDLRELLVLQQKDRGNAPSLGDALAERSVELVKEEEKLNSNRELITLTYDKLRAELTRVEAQLREHERHIKEVSQQKKLCKVALNMLVSGDVPTYLAAGTGGDMPAMSSDHAKRAAKGDADDTQGDGELQPSTAAPEPIPMKSSTAGSALKGGPQGEAQFHASVQSTTRAKTNAVPTQASSSASSSKDIPASTGVTPGAVPVVSRVNSSVSGTGLVAMLKIPDVKESSLLHGIESYDQEVLSKNNLWMATDKYSDVLTVLLSLLAHLPQPRPPVQLAELRVLGHVLQASPTNIASYDKNVMIMLEALINKGDAIAVLTKVLNSVNDDVKSEVLECLSPLVCGSHALAVSMPANAVCATARWQFLEQTGLDPLVNIVMCSTSEVVLERALVLLWGLLSREERTDAEHNGGKSIRSHVRELGGLRAVLDLLYTDSLAILENVCMVIGYITREDSSKKEIREIGGLEKITATLRHPSDSIKTKMAGAVWNCASNPENRAYLSQLGAIPALLELLRQKSSSNDDAAYEFVRENAAGALWNLSVDAENKSQILDYGGIPVLISAMGSSGSVAVVENVSGTLWNCSASVEARPLVRKAGGIPVLLSLLNDRKPASAGAGGGSNAVRPVCVSSTMPLSEKVLDNVAGTLRNCAINDQNKPVICEAGGVDLLLRKIKEGLLGDKGGGGTRPISANTIDKMASTLWILTISPEIKHTVRLAGGISTVTQILEQSSPLMAAKGRRESLSGSLFPPIKDTVRSTASSRDDIYSLQYSPAALSRIPSATPPLVVSMNIKEKIVGVLRNCSTAPENRVPMIEANAIRCLTAVVLDCYSTHTLFQASGSNHKTGSRPQDPSMQLKETVASALWYLARDDKVSPREQGGLELMCAFLASPQQPSVVLEQAAGALSSMSVNNSENRDAIRTYGGLQALMHLVVSKATVEYPNGKTGDSAGGAKNESASHTYAVLNALLTIRNCTVNNEENLKFCGDASLTNDAEFAQKLLYIVEHGSDESAREAALTIKNLCSLPKVLEYLNKHNAVRAMSGLSERAASDPVRRAAASALQALSRQQKSSK